MVCEYIVEFQCHLPKFTVSQIIVTDSVGNMVGYAVFSHMYMFEVYTGAYVHMLKLMHMYSTYLHTYIWSYVHTSFNVHTYAHLWQFTIYSRMV